MIFFKNGQSDLSGQGSLNCNLIRILEDFSAEVQSQGQVISAIIPVFFSALSAALKSLLSVHSAFSALNFSELNQGLKYLCVNTPSQFKAYLPTLLFKQYKSLSLAQSHKVEFSFLFSFCTIFSQ